MLFYSRVGNGAERLTRDYTRVRDKARLCLLPKGENNTCSLWFVVAPVIECYTNECVEIKFQST